MPASHDKIITKLRERRQIEAGLQRMLAATSEQEFRRRAQEIAALGSQVIPTLVSNLDRADARMLTSMGAVATFLDREEVVGALRQAVLQSRRTDRGRMGAITILERFLGQPPDNDLLTSLVDPEEVAIASLEEVLAQAARNPTVLIEYIRGLDRQEPDVVLAVARTLREIGADSPDREQPDRQVVEPLRMMAQDVRGEIAAEALEALGTIRSPEAARALQTLIPACAPELRSRAERSLRRLRFIGIKVSPLPAPEPDWRSLVSPVDGVGHRSIWFIQRIPMTLYSRFLNVLLSDRAGAVEAVGHAEVPPTLLPPRQATGYLHDIALPDGSGAMLMLEAPLDLGRRLVLEALEVNRATQIPVAGSLRLLSPWLWGYAGADSLPPRTLPVLPAGDEEPEAAWDRLLAHPAFSAWTARDEMTMAAAEEAARRPGWDLEVWVKRLARELFTDSPVAEVLSQRLVAMSEWLLLAGDEERARLALAAAQALLSQPPHEHPFAKALIRRDLQLVMASQA
jgi:hypothetical protein